MKKLFVLTSALAVALTASAAEPSGNPTTELQMPQTFAQVHNFAAPAKAAAKTMDDVVGRYVGTITERSGSQRYNIKAEFNLEATGENTIRFDGLLAHYSYLFGYEDIPSAVNATVDFEKGQVLIPSQYVATINQGGQQYDVTLVHMFWDGSGLDEAEGDFVGTLTDEGLKFADNDRFCLLTSINGSPADFIGDFELSALRKDYGDNDRFAPWEPIEGKATFCDPWVIPSFGKSIQPSDFPETVKLERSTVDPNVIRIVDPYKSSTFAASNQNFADEGYVVIDFNDPECVLVHTRYYSGYSHREYGKMYFYNFAALLLDPNYTEIEASNTQEVLEIYANAFLSASVLRDDKIWIFDSCYGFENDVVDAKYAGSVWRTDIIRGSLQLPGGFESGVSNILSDETAGTAEYFNLQGQKVEDPTPGLYILRQGNKATKVLVK